MPMSPATDGAAPGVLTANLTAVNQSVDVKDAAQVVVQITGTFTGTVVFEQSSNGTDWVAAPLTFANAVAQGVATQHAGAGAVNALYAGVVHGSRFRVRMSAFTSGTAVVLVEAFVGVRMPTALAAQGSRTASDGYSPALAQDTIGLNVGWNGTTWDRIRTGRARASGMNGLSVDTGTQGIASLNAATTAVAGTVLDGGSAHGVHAVQVVGGGATWTVVLEGTLDGTNWFTLGTIDNTNTSGGYLAVADRPCIQIRARTTVAPAAALTARIASVA